MKILLLSLLCLSCASRVEKAVRDVKYSAWETVGVEKRDLFKREISNVKANQEDSNEEFKDALERLQELYAFDGGNLEKQYNRLNSSYQDAQKEASEVKASIDKLDLVARDLFDEWSTENSQMKTADLRSTSQKQLKETKTRYQRLHEQLVASEKKMTPVLDKLHDQVLFLKHNLNAKAIAGLKTEGDRIQSDIESLMKDVNASIAEADKLIKEL
jgi:copper chaperone CopZ